MVVVVVVVVVVLVVVRCRCRVTVRRKQKFVILGRQAASDAQTVSRQCRGDSLNVVIVVTGRGSLLRNETIPRQTLCWLRNAMH